MSLAELILEFCHSVIIDRESRFYKSGKLLAILTDPIPAATLCLDDRVEYMNSVYISLIKKSDEHLVKTFAKMCSKTTHSIICLLKMICITLKFVHGAVLRFKLDAKTYETYMASIQNQLVADNKPARFLETINAYAINPCNCEKVDISKEDPEFKLFRNKQTITVLVQSKKK